ncbi:hypothetical protein XF14_30595 [Burkholderia gladioli]|nr:hypothetical protein XF14_30595 [Burkholderia gladioli]
MSVAQFGFSNLGVSVAATAASISFSFSSVRSATFLTSFSTKVMIVCNSVAFAPTASLIASFSGS